MRRYSICLFLLTVTFIPVPLSALSNVPGVCVGNCGGGGNSGGRSTYASPGTPVFDPEADRRREGLELNEKGLEAYKKEEWDAASRYFRDALERRPGDATIKQYLSQAEARLAELQGVQERQKDEGKNREQFFKDKQVALDRLKGTTSTEFGLKGPGNGGVKLKGLEGAVDSSVVDLRHLDPDKPATVDPNVVKGIKRTIPVQVSEKTLKNQNYIKAFDAIKAGDPSASIPLLKLAQAELPGDLLIRNALAFAEDLVATRAGEAKKRADLVKLDWSLGTIALVNHNYSTARKHLEAALRRAPKNRDIRIMLQIVSDEEANLKEGNEIFLRMTLSEMEKVRRHALLAIRVKDLEGTIAILEKASAMSPDDRYAATWAPLMRESRARLVKERNRVFPGSKPF